MHSEFFWGVALGCWLSNLVTRWALRRYDKRKSHG